MFFPISSSNDNDVFLPVPSAPKDPKKFAVDLVASLGSSIAPCGEAANNSPQVDWTCAQYTKDLDTFINSWNRLESSPLFKRKHDFTAMSDWMYFEIDGEIDFFYRTYDLKTTQALVTYDPSETGNELIVGLNPIIGTQIAAANGSNALTEQARQLPIQQ